MADVDGSWDCTVKSPLGDQNLNMTVVSDGSSFTGNASGAMGAAEVKGSVDGNTLAWTQSITVPMPLTLDCTATVEGDVMTGTVGIGAFGSFPLSGKRVG